MFKPHQPQCRHSQGNGHVRSSHITRPRSILTYYWAILWSRPRCRLSVVLLPAQSYFTMVPNGIAHRRGEDSLDKFKELEQQFNSGNGSSDPWSHVDSLGRAKFQKVLSSVYRVSKAATSSRSASESDSASSTPSPRKANRKVAFGPEVTPGGSCAGEGVRFSSPKPNSSKDYVYIVYICFKLLSVCNSVHCNYCICSITYCLLIAICGL